MGADGTAKSLKDIYARGIAGTHWTVPQNYEACFDFRYDKGRETMMTLYQKGKEFQWDAVSRIDWSLDLDEENPMELPDALLPINEMPLYQKMSDREKANVRRHYQAWNISQFMQGEQGALISAAKIVTNVPDLDSKFYASTQVIDEARHVEAYKGLLQKFGVAYPMTRPLQELLDQTLRDNRWDMTYLGMQVVIEGLALAAFQGVRDHSQNPLASMVNAYVMQDESRHVAFGRLALRDYYPQLTEHERNEREEFLEAACWLMRDRFDSREVWETLGLPADECVAHLMESEGMQSYRNFLFMRIVPIVKDIGLWGPRMRNCYEKMGVLAYADTDLDQLQRDDERIAKDFDERRKHVESVVELGREKSS